VFELTYALQPSVTRTRRALNWSLRGKTTRARPVSSTTSTIHVGHSLTVADKSHMSAHVPLQKCRCRSWRSYGLCDGALDAADTEHVVTQPSLVRSLTSFESSLNDKLNGGGHEIRSNSADRSIGKAAHFRGG
jgi:hypothetical protein